MRPRRILMTTDAVGGVWRYGVDLARALNGASVEVLLVCLGPVPSARQAAEAAALPATRLVCLDEPLDWLAGGAADLGGVPRRLDELAERHAVDLLHLNVPSQASGLRTRRPVVAVSHSCVATWWDAMRRTDLPAAWQWQREQNREGFRRADVVVAPSQSHGEALHRAYGRVDGLRIVPNAVVPSDPAGGDAARQPFVLAAARWWDEGKNGAALDRAAAEISWPVRAAGARRGANGQVFAFANAVPMGELAAGEMRALMARAAIFVSPSLYEPFGLAALEAAEAGAALVLADIPTYRELWEGAALFADPRDPDALAAAMEALVGDGAARRDGAARARRRARDFTPERQLEALFAAYGAATGACAAVREPARAG